MADATMPSPPRITPRSTRPWRAIASTWCCGSKPQRQIPDRVRLDEPPHHAGVRLEMKSTRAAQSSWRRYYVAPGHFYGETQHAYPLEVLAEILGSGNSSRLYQSLVLKQHL